MITTDGSTHVQGWEDNSGISFVVQEEVEFKVLENPGIPESSLLMDFGVGWPSPVSCVINTPL